MKQFIVAISMFTIISTSIQMIAKSEKCKCSELLIETDCDRKQECFWDDQNVKCIQKTNSTESNDSQLDLNENDEPITNTISLFCKDLNGTSCKISQGCSWYNNQCSHFTGCTVYFSSSNEECQSISNRCISDGQKCVEINQCNTYKTTQSCSINQKGNYCYWNTVIQQCEDMDTCEKLPQKLTTDQECRSYISECTANIGGGCILSGYQCNDQITQISCVTNRFQDQDCMWIDNKCLNKNCEFAPTSYIIDEQCIQIQSYCTTKQGGGCIQRTTCSNATNEQSCITDQQGNKCFWAENKCQDSLCSNAPSNYITNELCKQIKETCITNGLGCVEFIKCSSAKFEEVCTQDRQGIQCIWDKNICRERKCSDSNQNLIGQQQCQNYMITCTGKLDNSQGCIEKSCDNAPESLVTNEECEEYLSNNNCITKLGGGCKTNTNCLQIDVYNACIKDVSGAKCYWNLTQDKCWLLGECLSIKDKSSCIIDSNNQQCDWVEKYNNQYCITKSCFSAPLALTTEQECQEYFTPTDGSSCTVQKGGGCATKTQCNFVTLENACTTDQFGKSCFWESTINQCRYKYCGDFKGNSHGECNKQDSTCTLGDLGQCQIILSCNQYLSQNTCIFGINGSCLWIDAYQNSDETKGACFDYQNCESLNWKTNNQCKLISSKCTTDGEKCVPLTTCSETNINGGCYTGTDGQCVQTIPTLNSTKPQICKKFYQCGNAYFLTHQECQKANKQCTTDGVYGCMQLTSCQYYSQESCYLNGYGIETNSRGEIISTGKCIWNQQQCLDESCSDFIYNSPQECSQKLYKCTFDGTKCILKTDCSTYIEQTICENGGIDGSCLWIEQFDKTQSYCRRKTCNDIIQGSTQQACNQVDGCITDGQKCIPTAICTDYITQVACNQNGQDGICFWNKEKNECAKMKNCSDASNDQIACYKANDRCYWNNNNSITSCIQHTCETYKKQVGYCKYLSSWDYQSFIICKQQLNDCIQIEITQLTQEDCYPLTQYQYAWNSISNKCAKCNKVQETEKNEDQDNYISLNSSAEQLLIIGIIFLLL